MVRAWFVDCENGNQQLENHRNPPKFLDIKELYEMSGVEYFKIDHKNYENDQVLKKLKKDRGYTYEDDLICSKECLQNYEEKLKSFFTEHLHTDEEIRLALDGSGYFDIRDKNDEWIRIEFVAGDMIILPSGIYHRFTLDVNNFIRVKRYFIGEPVWTSYNRPVDDMTCRQAYVKKLQEGFTTS